jgi:cysteine desulfuration protein SufE
MQGHVATIDDKQERIIAELNGRQDWFDKYDYLIGLGKDLPASTAELKTDQYALKGCQSSVWLRAEVRQGRLHFTADSDSLITRGMIALLLAVLEDATPAEAAGADLYFIDRTGLDQNLSPARANGLKTIAVQMQGLAQEYL